MAWLSPKLDWKSPAYPGPDDFNRIEGNTVELKKASTIAIEDLGNLITATNVEDALAELALKCR